MKPKTAITIVLVVGLAALVLVGNEGDGHSLQSLGKSRTTSDARTPHPVESHDAGAVHRQAGPVDQSGDPAALTPEDDLIDKAQGDGAEGEKVEGEKAQGDDVLPSLESSAPDAGTNFDNGSDDREGLGHKIDLEREARQAPSTAIN